MTILVQICYFISFCRKIYVVTKLLFEIPILCFISVLLESSGHYGATSETQYNTS